MKYMEKIKLKINFYLKRMLFLLKLLLGLPFVFSISLSFAGENSLRNVENRQPPSCTAGTNCTQDAVKNDCRDLLDDPNAPISPDLGEAPTGY